MPTFVPIKQRVTSTQTQILTHEKISSTHQTRVEPPFLQDRCHRAVSLHPLLYPLLRPDGSPHQCRCQECPLGRPFRTCQDISIWRAHHPRSRRCQTGKKVFQEGEKFPQNKFMTPLFRDNKKEIVKNVVSLRLKSSRQTNVCLEQSSTRPPSS